jgi:hypothetical protein
MTSSLDRFFINVHIYVNTFYLKNNLAPSSKNLALSTELAIARALPRPSPTNVVLVMYIGVGAIDGALRMSVGSIPNCRGFPYCRIEK